MNVTEEIGKTAFISTTVRGFSSYFDETGIFGKHEFLQTKPWAAFPVIILLTVASLVGTAGNVLTLLAIASNKKVRNVESMFIVNLAMSDLYVTTVADPVSIIAKLEGEHFFDRVPRLCQVIAKLCTISCVTSLLTITTMSLNRYIYVCHNSYYLKIFSKRTSIIICMSVYCVGLVLVLLNQAGIGDHGFDRKSLDCIWDRMATYPYTVVYSVTIVGIPCFVIGVCYLRLYFFVQYHKKKVRKHQKRNTINSPGTSPPPRPKLQLAKTFILIYAVFVTCWAPYALLIVVDHQDAFLHEIHVYFTVWAHMHPSLNWLIYYFTQPKFAVAYRKILACSSHPVPRVTRSRRSAQNSSEEKPIERHPSEILKVYKPSGSIPEMGDVVDMEWKPIGREKSELSSLNSNMLSNNNVGIYRKLYDELRNIHSEGEIHVFLRDGSIKSEPLARLRETQSVDLTESSKINGSIYKETKSQGLLRLADGVKELKDRSSAIIDLIDKVCDSHTLIGTYKLSGDEVQNYKTCGDSCTKKQDTTPENSHKDIEDVNGCHEENCESPSSIRTLTSIHLSGLDCQTNEDTADQKNHINKPVNTETKTVNIECETVQSREYANNAQMSINSSGSDIVP